MSRREVNFDFIVGYEPEEEESDISWIVPVCIKEIHPTENNFMFNVGDDEHSNIWIYGPKNILPSKYGVGSCMNVRVNKRILQGVFILLSVSEVLKVKQRTDDNIYIIEFIKELSSLLKDRLEDYKARVEVNWSSGYIDHERYVHDQKDTEFLTSQFELLLEELESGKLKRIEGTVDIYKNPKYLADGIVELIKIIESVTESKNSLLSYIEDNKSKINRDNKKWCKQFKAEREKTLYEVCNRPCEVGGGGFFQKESCTFKPSR
uniref:Uncharacterized protein n=1 Tax=Pithovirus LCDPAC01 TaxID=2506600 RepID=A0A481YMK7_9VIRU|nr:MAG: hypothetical protein LCDPAC01_00500 [Pithovirus LCDPAC01]